ncbi:hypothetical protein QTO34_019358, partial [Cnephaeus nilssonii]
MFTVSPSTPSSALSHICDKNERKENVQIIAYNLQRDHRALKAMMYNDQQGADALSSSYGVHLPPGGHRSCHDAHCPFKNKRYHGPGGGKPTLCFPQVGHRPHHHPGVTPHQIATNAAKTPLLKMLPTAQSSPARKRALWVSGMIALFSDEGYQHDILRLNNIVRLATNKPKEVYGHTCVPGGNASFWLSQALPVGLQNKDAIIKRISEFPLSRNIIKDRIMRLNTNVQHQLKRDIRKCKYFSISLDETTDVTSHAQLAIIGRYSDGLTMREELIKLVSVSTSKSGSEIFKVVIQTFRDLSIDISKVVSVTTDGAPNMVGEKVGFVKLFTEAIGHPLVPFHCIIHQEALCAKAGFTDLNDLMSVVTKIAEALATEPKRPGQFSALLLEVDSTFSGLLMYNNVRWLSRGKVLERFVECFEEIKVFLDNKDLGNFPQLNDDKWVNTLMFFTDLSVHINELNLKLQGFGKSIDVMFGYIKAFESKVKIFKRDVETKTYKYFPRELGDLGTLLFPRPRLRKELSSHEFTGNSKGKSAQDPSELGSLKPPAPHDSTPLQAPQEGPRLPRPQAPGPPHRTWRVRPGAPGLPALGLPRPVAVDAPFGLVAALEEERRRPPEAPSCRCHGDRGHTPPSPRPRARGLRPPGAESEARRRPEPGIASRGAGSRSPARGRRPRARAPDWRAAPRGHAPGPAGRAVLEAEGRPAFWRRVACGGRAWPRPRRSGTERGAPCVLQPPAWRTFPHPLCWNPQAQPHRHVSRCCGFVQKDVQNDVQK